MPVDAVQSYDDYYHRFDHVLTAVRASPIGRVNTGTELMPLVRNNEFDAGWLRPLGISDGLFVRLPDGTRPTCLVIAGPKQTESFDTLERVKLVSGLVPHCSKRSGHKTS